MRTEPNTNFGALPIGARFTLGGPLRYQKTSATRGRLLDGRGYPEYSFGLDKPVTRRQILRFSGPQPEPLCPQCGKPARLHDGYFPDNLRG